MSQNPMMNAFLAQLQLCAFQNAMSQMVPRPFYPSFPPGFYMPLSPIPVPRPTTNQMQLKTIKNQDSPQKLDFSIASLASTSSSSTSTIDSTFSPKSEERTAKTPPMRSVVNDDTAKPLIQWMQENMSDPYPKPAVLQMLMKQTGFTKQQIQNWFTNHRRRIKEDLEKRGERLPWEMRQGPVRRKKDSESRRFSPY